MLPPDTSFLSMPLVLLALSFRPVTADILLLVYTPHQKASVCVMPGARKLPPPEAVAFGLYINALY